MQLGPYSLGSSNLGGAGPDSFAQEGVQYADVFPFRQNHVDLGVILVGGYPAKSQPSGVDGVLGAIYVDASQPAILDFRFTSRDAAWDGNPYFVTLVNVDFSVDILNFDSFTLDNESELTATAQDSPRVALHVESKVERVPELHGVDPTHLPQDLRRRSVSLKFTAPSFRLTVWPKADAQEGEVTTVAFAGSSSLEACPRIVPCTSFECPVGMANRPDAASHYCKSDPCTWSDAEVCCRVATSESCEDSNVLDLRETKLMYSNLGGLGPDLGSDRGILLSDVLPHSGKVVDMRITATNEYHAKDNTLNKVTGKILNLNLKTSTATDFLFEFLDRAGEPTEVKPFYMTLLDVDHQGNGDGKEYMEVVGLDVIRTANTHLARFDAVPSLAKPNASVTRIMATEHGVYRDNVFQNVYNLTADHLAEVVSIRFPGGKSFTITLGVEGGMRKSGRNMQISGATNAVCPNRGLCSAYTCPKGSARKAEAHLINCAEKVCTSRDTLECCDLKSDSTACEPENLMQFSRSKVLSNNLGGRGPDLGHAELVLMDVLPHSKDTIDMVIASNGEYLGDPTLSGVRDVTGTLLTFNVNGGCVANLTARFVRRDTGEEVVIDSFYVTFLGVVQKETVGVSGYEEDWLTRQQTSRRRTTPQLATPDTGSTLEGASSVDAPDNAPLQVRNLTSSQTDEAVTYLLGNRSRFNIYLAAPTRRSFFIAGASSMTCPRLPLCNTMKCPFGFRPRDVAANVTCIGDPCQSGDAPTCCEKIELEECNGANTLAWGDEDVLHSNLAGLGPSFGEPQKIIIQNVFPSSAREISLVIEAIGNFTRTATFSSINHSLGRLVLPVNSSVTLRFAFMDAYGELPTTPDGEFYFSLVDLKQQATACDVNKTVSIPDALRYELSEETTLRVNGSQVTAVLQFGDHRHPTGGFHPRVLTQDQTASTFTALVAQKESFDVNFACTGPLDAECDFVYSGASNLICPARATCGTFRCPSHFFSKPGERYLACSGDRCGDEDIATCCIPDDKGPWSGERVFSVGASSLLWSNLGGFGPDGDRHPTMRIGNVFPSMNQTIDLDIQVNDTVNMYTPEDAGRNTIADGLVHISVKPDTKADLIFRFIDRETQENVNVGPFYWTAYDIINLDAGFPTRKISKLRPKKLSSSVYSNASVTGDAEVDTGATIPPFKDLTKATSWLLPRTGKIRMTLARLEGDFPGPFSFGGCSGIVCAMPSTCDTYVCPKVAGLVSKQDAHRLQCKGPTCTPVDDQTCCELGEGPGRDRLVLRPKSMIESSTPGENPEVDPPVQKVVIGDVLPSANQTVDLKIESLGNSTVRVNDQLGATLSVPIVALAVEPNKPAVMRFQYVDRETQEPLEMGPMYFTWFNFFPQGTPLARSTFKIEPMESFTLSPTTTIHTNEDGSFTGEEQDGVYPDGNTTPMALNPRELDAVVTTVVPRTTSYVVHFMSSGESLEMAESSTFFFGGAVNMVLPTKAACSSFTCPPGLESIKDRFNSECASTACGEEDVSLCCGLPEESNPCHLKRQLVLHNIASSNMGGFGPDTESRDRVLYRNVFPFSDRTIDMEVTATNRGEYHPAQPSVNGLQGKDRGSVSLKLHSKARLRFRFVTSDLAKKMEFCPVGEGMPEFGEEDAPNENFMQLRTACLSDNEEDFEEGDCKVAGSSAKHPKFCKSKTQAVAPVVVPAFWFSVLNFESKYGVDQEMQMSRKYYSDLRTTRNSTIRVKKNKGEIMSQPASGASALPHPLLLDEPDKDRSASFFMKPASQFIMEVDTHGHSQQLDGIVFQFAGASNLVCPKRAPCDAAICPAGFRKRWLPGLLCAGEACNIQDINTCCTQVANDACSPAGRLKLDELAYNNLDFQGPDDEVPAGVRFRDVFPGSSSDPIDLEITAETQYHPRRSESNHFVGGGYFQLNLKSGTETTLLFQLKDSVSNCERSSPAPFYFTFFDLVQDSHGASARWVAISDKQMDRGVEYNVTDDTLLNVTRVVGDDNRRYTQFYPMAKEVPEELEGMEPMELSTEHKQRSVGFMFGRGTEAFRVKVGVAEGAGSKGHSIVFGGSSSVSCLPPKTCEDYVCHDGYKRRAEPHMRSCRSSPCTEADHPTCCEAPESAPVGR